MMQSQSNGNPFPEKWTVVCTATKGAPSANDGLVEPCDTEEDARRAFDNYKARLVADSPAYRVTSARIIPPDGDGDIIVLVSRQPARTK